MRQMKWSSRIKQKDRVEEDSKKNCRAILVSKPEYKDYFIKSMVKMESLDLEIPDEEYKKEIKKDSFGNICEFYNFWICLPLTNLVR